MMESFSLRLLSIHFTELHFHSHIFQHCQAFRAFELLSHMRSTSLNLTQTLLTSHRAKTSLAFTIICRHEHRV